MNHHLSVDHPFSHFKYSKYHHKGASCIVRAGDKFADLMSTGMTRVASAHIVPPKNCETMYDDDNLDNCS